MRYHQFVSRSTVINHRMLCAGEKLLLIVLRAMQNPHTGECVPTREELCRACGGITHNTLNRWRDGLKDRGMIVWSVHANACSYNFLPKSVSNEPLPHHLTGRSRRFPIAPHELVGCPE